MLDLRHMGIGDTFQICQAGYSDRKLLYDTRTGSFYVVPKTTHHTDHHELFEGVIYNNTASSKVTKFYIRRQQAALGHDAPHHEILEVRHHSVVSDSLYRSGRRGPVEITPRHNVEDIITHSLMEAHYIS